MVERITRLVVGLLGVLAGLWGVRGLWEIRSSIKLANFGEWLIGGVILHDLIIANVVLLVGYLLSKTLPARIRGYVQGGLIVIALTGSFAFFVIWRQGTIKAASVSLLRQDYLAHYAVIVAIVVVVTAVLYVASLRNVKKSRPE